MNIVLSLAHSIEEYDQLRLLSGLGYDVFSIGAYTNPAKPTDDKRPPLPEARYHEALAALIEGDQFAHKSHLPDELVEWGDVFIVHHFLDSDPHDPSRPGFIPGNWDRIRDKRVIWRTVGQSDPSLEQRMARYRAEGLQIVRYSPNERTLPAYAGEDTLIRFYKDPTEWSGWVGYRVAVGNITQHMRQRGDACGYRFWDEATQGAATMPAGPGSEELPNGRGALSYADMKAYLRAMRVYLYTGTRPAPYTLGLLEALMTGTPIVSIGKHAWWPEFPYLFEADEFCLYSDDEPRRVRRYLSAMLRDLSLAQDVSDEQRKRTIETFGIETVGAAWRDFLGAP